MYQTFKYLFDTWSRAHSSPSIFFRFIVYALVPSTDSLVAGPSSLPTRILSHRHVISAVYRMYPVILGSCFSIATRLFRFFSRSSRLGWCVCVCSREKERSQADSACDPRFCNATLSEPTRYTKYLQYEQRILLMMLT